MTVFVLVPGAWKGAWAYEHVVPLLERAGHTAHALTLTGLRPDDEPAVVATAGLDTHASDVLRLLDRTGATGVTLVGHSYAGLVVAAAADRAAGRVARLVHLDAYVPDDGDSCWSSTNAHFREVFAAGAADTGYSVAPPGHRGDPRRRPHPLASFLQTVRLTGAHARVPRREFVYCAGWEDRTPFTGLRDRLLTDPGWRVHTLPTGHDAMREDPEAVAALLLDAGKGDGPTLRSDRIPVRR
ncbi:alpha/beta fold hydrolase [Streptomyces sp. NPDC057682]|uniref:alpha/beta fold hydrolase n=1 Tax=Streptomyces sp. NPDC057682 TaxID=3346210 RepID=UPI0036D08BF0